MTQSEDSSPLGFSLRLIQDRDVNVSSRKVRNRDPVHHPRRRLLKRGVEKSEVLHTFEDSGLAARLLAPAGVACLCGTSMQRRQALPAWTCCYGGKSREGKAFEGTRACAALSRGNIGGGVS